MRRPGPDEWRALIAEYQTGELTQKEFVTKHGVALSTFLYWLYKRRKLESKIDGNSPAAFLPIDVVASPALTARDGALCEAALRSGVTVRFAVGTDPRYLAELVAALG